MQLNKNITYTYKKMHVQVADDLALEYGFIFGLVQFTLTFCYT